jgi:hypothetical protein
LATLKCVAKDFRAGSVDKPKKKQMHPWRKIGPKMAATIVPRLTIKKAHHSFRSIAKDFNVSLKAVQIVMKNKAINCYMKRKRNLIPNTQQEMRKKCCAKFRKLYRKTDIPNFVFVNECYVTLQKHFNHQNE